MAYKLYINNKLFSGMNGNNYNKGSITINGTTYQFDNGAGSYEPVKYLINFSDSTFSTRTPQTINFGDNSYVSVTANTQSSSAVNMTNVTFSDFGYTITGRPIKTESSTLIDIYVEKPAKLSIVVVSGASISSSNTLIINGTANNSFTTTPENDSGSAYYYCFNNINLTENSVNTIRKGNGSNFNIAFLEIEM